MKLYELVRKQYGDVAEWRRRVRERMETEGLTQRALARRAGLDEACLSRALGGRGRPRLETMLTVDEALDELEQKNATV